MFFEIIPLAIIGLPIIVSLLLLPLFYKKEKNFIIGNIENSIDKLQEEEIRIIDIIATKRAKQQHQSNNRTIV